MIFLDIQMEGMGGIEAARTLRQSGVDAVVISLRESGNMCLRLLMCPHSTTC